MIAACSGGPSTPDEPVRMAAVTATPPADQTSPITTVIVATETPSDDAGAGAITPLPVSTATPAISGVPMIAAGSDQVPVYRTPSENSPIAFFLNDGAPVTPMGRNAASTWIQIDVTGGDEGWIVAEQLDNLAIDALPVVVVEIVEITPTSEPHAYVRDSAPGLRLRAAPVRGRVQVNLDAGTALFIAGRTADNTWLEVITTEGDRGWVAAQFLEIRIAIASVPVTGEITVAASPTPAVSYYDEMVVSNITDTAREIVRSGRQRGNRSDVFSKVGDSLTVATWFLYPVGWGTYDAGEHAYLEPVIAYFSRTTARDSNSFASVPLAADNGWTTRHLLDPGLQLSDVCLEGEMPLECEYRVVRPAVALILIGTNDVAAMEAPEYRQNLQRVVDVTIENGVLPVLSTIPDRPGFDDNVAAFNRIIQGIALEAGVPLWDYHALMRRLPDFGLSEDYVHPSAPSAPGDWASATVFRGQNLRYGFTIRNLTALQVLDAIWRQVLTPA